MAEWSQTVFLQALGWATLNSFWQMGLLWCLYLLLNHFFCLSASSKFRISAWSVAFGFFWFCYSFFSFNQSSGFLSPMIGAPVTASYLNVLLVAASVAYLLLLVFPAYKLFKNWQFVQKIKKDGLHKAAFEYRLYIQKVAAHLNIKSKVAVFVSDLVSSPVTVGYFKPLILLPVAALNNLSVSQVEAILLHELSHIKRADYLLNFLINIVHTILYFNPFVKLFMQQIDAERENCCDEMVLQFGYDKVAYCSALLTLEKSASRHQALALGVTGRKNLLTRIEKIVGMEKKKRYSLAQVVPAFAAIICIFAFNSVLILNDTAKADSYLLSSSTAFNPFYLIDNGSKKGEIFTPAPFEEGVNIASSKPIKSSELEPVVVHITVPSTPAPAEIDLQVTAAAVNPHIIPVAFDVIDASLSPEQKEQVTTTIDATKEILNTLQWKQVESSMADALDAYEKELVKEAYTKELSAVNWENIEKNLKANYEKIDWTTVNADLNKALNEIELDKLEKQHRLLLEQLQKTEKEIHSSSSASCVLPDASLKEIQKAKAEVKKSLEQIKSAKEKKIIRL